MVELYSTKRLKLDQKLSDVKPQSEKPKEKSEKLIHTVLCIPYIIGIK